MKLEFRQKLKGLMLEDEGMLTKPYLDCVGKITIGVGRNLADRGISQTEAFTLLDNDIAYFETKLKNHFLFFESLNQSRQIVLINICFNVGFNGFLEFVKLIAAVEKEDFEEAAKQILDSDASRASQKRYKRLAEIMKTGEFIL